MNYTFDHDLFLLLSFDGGKAMDFIMETISGTLMWIPLYLFVLAFVWYKFGWQRAIAFVGVVPCASSSYVRLGSARFGACSIIQAWSLWHSLGTRCNNGGVGLVFGPHNPPKMVQLGDCRSGDFDMLFTHLPCLSLPDGYTPRSCCRYGLRLIYVFPLEKI